MLFSASGRTVASREAGYTLVELMITVAVIGIILSMALPAYQSYKVRAELSEGFNLIGPIQTGLMEYYNDYGTFPADNAAAGVQPAENYAGNAVAKVSVSGAVISIEYGNNANKMINGKTVTVTGVPSGGSMVWNCSGGASIPDAYLPSSC